MSNNVYINGRSVEIERKYLIKMPDTEILKAQPGYSGSYIEQMYISGEGSFGGDRIRKREYPDGTRYFKTHKENINGISKFETEEEISEELYDKLSKQKLVNTRAIKKVRHCFEFRGQLIEIDIYEFWDDKATLEVELQSEEQEVYLPGFIDVIEDVTGDNAYSNYSLSRFE